MTVIRRRNGPADYSLCNQTVTLYRWNGGDSVTRRVIEKGAFLDVRRVRDVSKTGSREAGGFLLVIPCSEVPVQAGDKVFLGEGPEIAGRGTNISIPYALKAVYGHSAVISRLSGMMQT